MKHILILFIISLSLSSCGTYSVVNTFDFGKISDLSELNGSYFSDPYIGTKHRLIGYTGSNADTDFVTICFPDDHTFRISCLNNGVWEMAEFKGEKKEEYFEIYLERNTRIIPLIYSKISIQRIRIGKYKNTNDLLIGRFLAKSGNILIIADGYQVERPFVYKKMEE